MSADDRAFAVLSAEKPLTATQVRDEMGLPRTTSALDNVQRVLARLRLHGRATRLPDNTWVPVTLNGENA